MSPIVNGGGAGGGSGTVTNVASADTSIVVTNPTTTPSLKLGTLSTIAANEGGTVPIANGGTANTTAAAAFAALAPLTTAGDLLIENAVPAPARLAVGSGSQVLGISGGLPAWVAAPTSPGGLAVYGDGSDGTVTFDGSTTILGMAPSSSIYTLTRDFFFAAATINNGVTIVTNGYRIFCAGALTNNGTIRWNGNNASGTNGATAGAALGNGSGSVAADGSLGGVGATGTSGNGANGTSETSCVGGAGGAGGTGATTTAGSGGAATGPQAKLGGFRSLPTAVLAGFTLAGTPSGASLFTVKGGAGGGSGGGDATNAGGGGGGGGGIVMVASRTIAGTGAIQARGGNGGTVTTSTLGAAGGGGGGGGQATVISSSVSAGAVAGQTIDANGGAAGTGLGATFTAAAAGSSGTVILLPN